MGAGLSERLPRCERCILAENALECIWTYDTAAGRFTYVSPAVQRLMGYTVDETMNLSLAALLSVDSLQKANETIETLLARYRQGERQESMLTHCGDYMLRCKDQTEKQAEITAKLLRNEETGALELLGITRDITQRKELERQLHEAIENQNAMIRRLSDSEKTSKVLAEELLRKNQILLNQATRDSLTGAYNRFHFDRKVAEEANRCQRYRQPLSIALFDIDNFKEINDTRGHQSGDDVLSNIVGLMQQCIRIYDTLARWGGDEFILLMPQTSLREATVVSEKIRQEIESVSYGTPEKPVTVSIGVVELLQGEQAESWFRRVDYALFRSKSEGKNRVTAMDWETSLPFMQIRLEWKSSWECGHPAIDGQHKKLVTLGNRLLSTALVDLQSKEAADSLDALILHIQQHFADEERVLCELGYPGLDEHAKIHRALLKQTEALLSQHRLGKLKPSAIFTFLLDEVVMGHLLREDIRFFPYTKRSGTGVSALRKREE